MNISSTQRAYLAGFLDGDGSIYVRAKPNMTYRFGYQIAPSIVLFQSSKNKMFLQEIHRMINVGYIRERKDGVSELTINKLDDILLFMKMVKPFTKFKRRQAELLEKIISYKEIIKNKEDFAKLLKLVNAFSKINYSKKRKIRILTP